MRVSLLACVLILSSSTWAQEHKVFEECDKKAPTGSQAYLNDCAHADYQSAENELNQAYEELLKKAADEPVAVEKIKAAQSAWVAFRNAQIAALYPHDVPDKRLEYGTVYPMCVSLLKSELTQQRTKMLREMLHPLEDDVCSNGLYYPERTNLPKHQQNR